MKTEKELKQEIERRIIDFANEACRNRLRKQGHEVLDDYEYYKLKYGGGFIRAINKTIDLTRQERNAEVKQVIEERLSFNNTIRIVFNEAVKQDDKVLTVKEMLNILLSEMLNILSSEMLNFENKWLNELLQKLGIENNDGLPEEEKKKQENKK